MIRNCLFILGIVVAVSCSSKPEPDPLAPDVSPTGEVLDGGATQAELDQVKTNWRPQFEPDYNRLTAQPGVEPTTTAQTNDVRVSPTSLEFSASQHPEVLDWEAGRIVAAAPGAPGSAGSNPFGFARKVVAVVTDGGTIEVITEVASLEDVVQGEILAEFDPERAVPVDLSKVDLEWAAENLYQDYDVMSPEVDGLADDSAFPDFDEEGNELAPAGAGDPLFGSVLKAVKSVASAVKSGVSTAVSTATKAVTTAVAAVAKTAVTVWKAVTPDSFNGSLKLDKELTLSAQSQIMDYTFKKSFNKRGKLPMEFEFTGKGDFEGSLTFNPRTQLGVKVPNIGSSTKFTLTMNVDSYLRTKAQFTLDLEAALRSADGETPDKYAKKIQENVEFAQTLLNQARNIQEGDPDAKPAGGWKKTLFISKPATQTIFAGPVPVVFTQTFQLDLECGFEAKASLKTVVSSEQSMSLKFKAVYEKGGNSFIEGPTFDRQANRSIQVTGGGSVVLSCGLIPRINAFVYDSVGINAGVRGSLVAKAEYKSECQNNPNITAPKGTVGIDLSANVGIQFGGRIQAPGSSFAGKAGQKLGVDIGPLELWSKSFPIWNHSWNVPGLGYCSASCRNRSTSSLEPETDVDCGDQCSTKCAAGKKCKVNSDCDRAFCSSGVCSTDHCGDGVLSGDETSIDCGGAKCGACALKRACFTGRDCRSGLCAVRPAPASRVGTCVADHCQDFVQNLGETGPDCGGGGCRPCKLNEVSNADVGCETRFSNGTICVATSCQDRKVSGSESDVDCGGPSGANACNRCAIGKRCNVNLDCYSGPASAVAPVCNATTKVCVRPTCSDGSKNQTETGVDCGGPMCSMNKCPSGQGCAQNSDCQAGLACNSNTRLCAAPSCTDGIKNQTETDIDCGGTCGACANNRACVRPVDCQSGVCRGNLCSAPTCTDGAKNGSETDVDCGGNCLNKCGPAQACAAATDCTSQICTNALCVAPTCSDAVKNGTESDVDCGGSCATKCAPTRACLVPGDCLQRVCVSNVCAPATCADLVKNGVETDIDCGGTCARKCAPAQGCLAPTDCTSSVCMGNVCSAPGCMDLVKNGTESDVDCGGMCSLKCLAMQSCVTPADCQSRVCTMNACVAATCSDTVKNGSETDVDCGGACSAKCAATKSCAVNADCVDRVCSGTICQAASCNDSVKNGTESDVDCGGSCSVKCASGRVCAGNADCSSNVCTGNVCQQALCTDDVKNGNETDVDCGGPLCNACTPGQVCSASADCSTRVCVANTCRVASCSDGVRNGAETDVDCGGGTCLGCSAGRVCQANADCGSGLCTNSVCVNPTPQLTALWRFENDGVDSSGAGRTLSFTPSGTSFGTNDQCRSGTSCLVLGGSGGADVTFDTGPVFTVGSWVYLPSPLSSQINTVIATSTAGLNSDGWKLFVNTFGTGDRSLHFESGNGAAGCERVSAANVVPVDQWVHLAASVDRGTGVVTLFVNGVAQAATTNPPACGNTGFTTNRPISVGRTPGPFFALTGRLDETFISNYSMSPAQVTTQLNATVNRCRTYPCIFEGGTSTGQIGGAPGGKATADAFCNSSMAKPAGRTAVAFLSFDGSNQISNLGTTAPGYNATLPIFGPSTRKLANSLPDLLDYSLCADGCVNFQTGGVTTSQYWNFSNGDGTLFGSIICGGGTSAASSSQGMTGNPLSDFPGQSQRVACNVTQSVLCLVY